MKIATWNLERLKHISDIVQINSILTALKADILVLTETDERVDTKSYKHCIRTLRPSEFGNKYYLETENRVTICTNYEIVKQYETFDSHTSLCVELKTEMGILIVYGTIIGTLGNRNKSFSRDLLQQINDYKNLSKEKSFCLVGDYNITFSDNYYFTNAGRNALNKAFIDCNLNLLTRNKKECIDHIAISEKFISGMDVETAEWNMNKKLSDHKGIYVNLTSSTKNTEQ